MTNRDLGPPDRRTTFRTLSRLRGDHLNKVCSRDRAVATAATEELAKQYFDNDQVLLKYLVEELEQSIKRIYQIRDRWNDVLFLAYRRYHRGKKRHRADLLKFNLEKLKQSIDATKLVKWLVDQTSAKTLELIGDRQGAVDLFVSLVDVAI